MKDSNQPTTLYRLFDVDEALLYVGISGRWVGRIASHAKRQGWWDQVAAVTRQPFSSRSEALAAEAVAIRQESPRYNVQGKPKPGRPRKLRPARQPTQHDVSRPWEGPMSLPEVARRVGLSPQRINQLANDDAAFPECQRLGRMRVVDGAEAARYFAARQPKPGRPRKRPA